MNKGVCKTSEKRNNVGKLLLPLYPEMAYAYL